MSRRVPWVAVILLAGAAMAGGLVLGAGRWLLHLPPCPFKALTGYACASCGLTRWSLALGAGDWAGALHWHPVATVALAGAPVALLWDLRRAWRGEPYPALPDSGWARASAAGLLVLAWLLQAARGI